LRAARPPELVKEIHLHYVASVMTCAARISHGRDLDVVEHDVAFNRPHVASVSRIRTLVLRMDRLSCGSADQSGVEPVQDFPDVVESHRPIVDALRKGEGESRECCCGIM